MRIETIELANIGQFRAKKIIGPLDPGLNILAEPNEAGKSTSIKAITRAFFDRYNAQHEEIRALRPAGTTLCPQVAITFAAQGDRYKLEKCFLDKKSSDLLRWNGADWERIAESQQADNRVRELLGAQQIEGTVKVKPEHWGLLQFLWARQGEPASWPEWNGADGERARSMLAAVELDPVVRKISAALREEYGELFTPTGKVRANSALEIAQQNLGDLESRLRIVRAKRDEFEALEQQHANLNRELELLTRQREESAKAAEALKMQAEAAERQLAKLATLEAEFKNASALFERISADQESLKNTAAAIEQAEASTKLAEAKLDRASAELPAIERELEQTQNHFTEVGREREQTQARVHRIHALIQLRRLADDLVELNATHTRVAGLAAEVAQLRAQKAKLPDLTEKALKKLRRLDQELGELRAKIETSGLTVTLCALRDTSIETETNHDRQLVELSADQPHTLKTARSLLLTLPKWGTVRIASGAAEISELEKQQRAKEEEFSAALEETGLAKLDDAETARSQLVQMEQQIEKSETALGAHLGKFEKIAELEAEIARCERKIASQRENCASAGEEQSLSITALEAEEQRANVVLRQANEKERCLRTMLAELGAKHKAACEAREETAREISRLRAEIAVRSEQKARLLEGYKNDFADALAKARSEFVKAEARRDEAQRELPADAGKLPERSKHAARVAAQVDSEFQQKSDTLRRGEAQLEARGGEGLYSQQCALEEQIEQARAEALRLQKRGWAQRLVFELIERREHAATERVLRPLEDRLSAVFAELSGVRNRRVFFNEKLEIAGIGSRADEAHSFSELSQGGKEQLLLALRAAIALEVAKTEPPLLILDDVLVHTDPVRQQNVLEYLQTLAGQVQILVLTCHADRYRGAGKLLRLSDSAC